MNEKQKLFCEYYIETSDVKIAAKKAGYMEKTGIKLLKNEKIKTYIEQSTKESNTENKNIAKSNEIIECLTKIMRGEENDNLDNKSSKGISVKEKLKAAELLGKMYSIFSPKQEKCEEQTVYILGDNLIEE
ncbi:terminase small subunit [[Clostridium] colinum]|uniref:terminase small subunit n=1 Tax=[Clostridium] colinum TaxID=36835 RepID=UPI002023C789|nr:terminase small subunit [[Clostridium] colinum]